MRKRTTSEYIRTGFARIDRDLEHLMTALREVLESLGEKEASAALPWLRSKPGKGRAATGSIEQAYSIAFQLLNMVEENAAAQTRQAREIEHGIADEPGLWGQQLSSLKSQGVKESELAEFLPEVRIEPVLTAHPTEAKRSAVLEQHRAIYRILTSLGDAPLTPSQEENSREELRTALERLWRSGEILLQKPEVATERKGVIFYLREVFPQALRQLDNRFRMAWRNTGFNESLLDNPHTWPRVRFGTWVGGDRDGHPLVNEQTTQETLAELRLNALIAMHRNLGAMSARLPLSSHFQSPPKTLLDGIKRLREELGQPAQRFLTEYADEPWRQFALMVQLKLPLEVGAGERAEIRESAGRYRRPSELDADLRLLQDSLVEVGAGRLATATVWPARRALDVFGFHLAALDIRQNSRFHDEALAQILCKSGMDAADFPEWSEERRLEFLNEELKSPRPFLYSDTGIGPQADAVLACYRVIKHHITEYGIEGVGSLIVSMTRSLSDLLVVYVLAREAGLMHWSPEGLVCSTAVVPLFETAEDLDRSPALIEAFLSHPVTQRSLIHLKEERSPVLAMRYRQPVQQVMIGYSDSNKDCGIFASQWALRQAQHEITMAGHRAGTKIRFFHGRGGTISRGAGPTHRFLGALPPGSIQGDLRMTEQGETIAQKYANLDTATYNLEVLLAGVTGFSVQSREPQEFDAQEAKACEFVADRSRKAYEELIHAPDFVEFFREVTPIDALETSSIGSRPSRRTGRKSLEDLRAIPWVFSWNQCRYYLPGWYGVGTGLHQLKQSSPEDFRFLCQHLKSSPFLYYVLTNVETNLASTDGKIMREYLTLVSRKKVRDYFWKEIQREYNLTRNMMSELFGGKIESRRPRMLKTLHMRADALKLLHEQQIRLLKQWRSLSKRDNREASKLLPRVLLSINAIASGLRTTG